MPLASFSNTVTFTSKMGNPPNPVSKVTFASLFQPGKPLALFDSVVKFGTAFRGDSGDLLAGRYRE